jgi:hypothetical protein
VDQYGRQSLQITGHITRYFVNSVVELTAGSLSGDILGWLTHAVLVFRPCLDLCMIQVLPMSEKNKVLILIIINNKLKWHAPVRIDELSLSSHLDVRDTSYPTLLHCL